jgi:hypothetical protein
MIWNNSFSIKNLTKRFKGFSRKCDKSRSTQPNLMVFYESLLYFRLFTVLLQEERITIRTEKQGTDSWRISQ